MIGIIGAMEEEVSQLIEAMEEKEKRTSKPVQVWIFIVES